MLADDQLFVAFVLERALYYAHECLVGGALLAATRLREAVFRLDRMSALAPSAWKGIFLLIVNVLEHWRGSITVLRAEDNVLPVRRPRRRQFNLGGLAKTA